MPGFRTTALVLAAAGGVVAGVASMDVKHSPGTLVAAAGLRIEPTVVDPDAGSQPAAPPRHPAATDTTSTAATNRLVIARQSAAPEGTTEPVVTDHSSSAPTPTPRAPRPTDDAEPTTAPETEAPETEAPETEAPETETPETEAPETQTSPTPTITSAAPTPTPSPTRTRHDDDDAHHDDGGSDD
ncbi:MAG: hypothetical protein JWM93_974 [Frankiales bacterium]|nr:hypothetical protein [Frankiales bacterium]